MIVARCLLVALALCGTAVVPTASAALSVTGYALDGAAITAARGTVSDIGVVGATISSRGDAIVVSGAGPRAALVAAHAAGLPASLLVSNYEPPISG